MSILLKPSSSLRQIVKNPVKFAKDSRGVAAVEFALIAPILLLLFVGTVEVSFLVAIDRKISRASSSIADLVTQSESNSVNALENFLGVTERIMFPYQNRVPCVVISRVLMAAETDTNGDGVVNQDDEIIARVENSVDNSQGGSNYLSPPPGSCDQTDPNNLPADVNSRKSRAPLSEFPIPESIKADGAEIIVTEIAYDHRPIVGIISRPNLTTVGLDSGTITLSDRIFLRPRGAESLLPVIPPAPPNP